MSPSSSLAALNAGQPDRSPERTAIARAWSPVNIAGAGRLGSGPALGPKDVAP